MTTESGLAIGQIAREAGCGAASIRYYEQIGLLPRAGRRSGGHRVYGSDDVKRLIFIRRCRDFGFPIDKIRDLLSASADGRPCAEVKGIAEAHLEIVRAKLLEIHALERSLDRLVQRCSDTCADGLTQDCTLFDDIAAASPRCCGPSTAAR